MEVTKLSQQGAQASTATIVALLSLGSVYFRIHFLYQRDLDLMKPPEQKHSHGADREV